jgi:glucose-6-phosphate isomerase
MNNIKLTWQDISGCDTRDIEEKAELMAVGNSGLREMVDSVSYEGNEAFLSLPYDEAIRKEVASVSEELKSASLKYVVLVGIGGSSLGVEAIYGALRGKMAPYKDASPRLVVLDTIDVAFLNDTFTTILSDIKSPEEIAVVLISKSGETMETLFNFGIVHSELVERFGTEIKKRIAVVTNEGSPLWEEGKDFADYRLAIPEKVGGRYSVFSAVGLLPLSLLGIDIEALHLGARKATDEFLNGRSDNDNASLLAAILGEAFDSGKRELCSFFFNGELEALGKWGRQLFAESLGKEGKGFLPTVAVGSTDLHSMFQFYEDGAQGAFTVFVHALTGDSLLTVQESSSVAKIAPNIVGKDANRIMRAILHGVEESYLGSGLLYMEIGLSRIDEETIALFMQMEMIATMLIGQTFAVNAFDQPAVESYKANVRRILSHNS